MSHSEKRSHWIKEGLIGSATGMLYGVTNVAVGHPFDTLKTKMQAQIGYENLNMFKTIKKVYRTEGFIGYYRGCVPPLWGSGIFRSLQFSSFEAVYTYMNNDFGNYEIPLTYGLQIKVILGGLASGTCRALIETPLEYAKTHRQTGQNWKLKDTFTGFQITWLRSVILLPLYFMSLDSYRRHMNEIFGEATHPIDKYFIRPFNAGGIASIIAWSVIWPLEYMRTQVQAGYLDEKHMTVIQRLKFIINERGGFLGLYRGLSPGLCRSYFANGFAMIVMAYAQRKISELGLRE